jgi:hypothetical protein
MKTIQSMLLLVLFIHVGTAQADIYFSKDSKPLDRMVKIEERGKGMIRFLEFDGGQFKKVIGGQDFAALEVQQYSESRKYSVTMDWGRRVLVVGSGATIGWFGSWLFAGMSEYSRANVGRPPLKFQSWVIQFLGTAAIGGIAWWMDHMVFTAPAKNELRSALTCEAAIRPDIKFNVDLNGYSVSTAMNELQEALNSIAEK